MHGAAAAGGALPRSRIWALILPLHFISMCIVRTVRYLSSQGDSEAVRYTAGYPSVPGSSYCEFRGSGRSCSRSAAGISACSRPARQCPDRPVTPRSNPGMHAVSENSEFRIPKCPDCIRAESVRIPVLLILLHILMKWSGRNSSGLIRHQDSLFRLAHRQATGVRRRNQSAGNFCTAFHIYIPYVHSTSQMLYWSTEFQYICLYRQVPKY